MTSTGTFSCFRSWCLEKILFSSKTWGVSISVPPILLKQFEVACFGNLDKSAYEYLYEQTLFLPWDCPAASYLVPAWYMGRFCCFPFPLGGFYNRK
jgi:hypothetical protein